jgi:hypothetical protein
MNARTIAITLFVVLATSVAGCSASDTKPDVPTSSAPSNDLVLRPDGIGPFRIGDDTASVIEGISAEIGGWSADSSEGESTIPLPRCPGESTRLVAWDNLVLLFSGPEGATTFHSWTYGFDPVTGNTEDVRQLGLHTDDGIGLGTPRTEVEAVLGSRVTIVDDPTINVATFTIDGADAFHVSGRFPDLDAAAGVQTLASEPGCRS